MRRPGPMHRERRLSKWNLPGHANRLFDPAPQATCSSATTLVAYASPGSCSGGKCIYVPATKPCRDGCATGSCLPDPCLTTICDAPPPCFKSGTCVGGECRYDTIDVGKRCTTSDLCSEGASCNSAGACVGTPKSCTAPPSPVCADATTLRTFNTPGNCSGGSCSYTSQTAPCPAPPATAANATASCAKGVCGFICGVGFFASGTSCLPGTKIDAISTGAEDSCAVTSKGAIKCWGWNLWGADGDGNFLGQPGGHENLSPVDVVGLSAVAMKVSSGVDFTCALTPVGGVKCWGQGSNGQLGANGLHLTPVDVAGLTSGVSMVATGDFSCAVLTTGAVKCWGWDGFGQLGDNRAGMSLVSSLPIQVQGLTSGYVAVGAGQSYACALSSAGGVKCWGWNVDGMLGDNTTIERHTPVDVVGLGSGITALSVGNRHACVLTSGGGVRCWGAGPLGDGTATGHLTPIDVPGLGSGISAVSAGGPICVLTSAGGVKCWGGNYNGQLGDNSNTDRLTPVDVVGIGPGATSVSSIAIGGRHACVLTTIGGVKCWGVYTGNPSSNISSVPVDVTF